MNGADFLRTKKPQLTADLWLYPTEQQGRAQPIRLGYGCPCTLQREEGAGWVGYDGWPLLGDTPMAPGERRRLGFAFMSGQEAVTYLTTSPRFYLWEGRIIGEAEIVAVENSN